MLNQQTTKPYRIKWVEAERELVSRGVILPVHHMNHEHFLVHKDLHWPKIPEAAYPKRVPTAP